MGTNALALVVEDLTKDLQFSSKSWVSLLKAKYYVALPLLASNDVVLGFLVGIDTKASVRTAGYYRTLCNFAELATRQLEGDFHGVLKELNERPVLLREPQECKEVVMLCDVTSRWWNIEFADSNARSLHPTLKLDGSSFWGVFRPVKGGKNLAQEQAAQDIRQGNDFVLHVTLRDPNSSQEHLAVKFRPARGCFLSNTGTTIGLPRNASVDCLAPDVHTHYFGIIGTSSAEPPKEQAALAPEHTLMNQELFNEGSRHRCSPPGSCKALPSGMADVELGVGCLSSASTITYRSRWNKKIVAVKMVSSRPEECVRSTDGSTLIPPDALLSVKLNHPSVVTTFKVVVQPKVASSNGATYSKGDSIIEASYVKEWCGCGDLQTMMQQDGFLEADRETPKLKLILAVAKDIAEGMRYLHDQNILGASLHPSTIQLGLDENALDPGFKKFTAKIGTLLDAVESDHALHVVPPSPGTSYHAYAAPELVSKGLLSTASDVFAFGRLLWDMYAGSVLEWQSGKKALGQGQVHAGTGIVGSDPLGFETLLNYCLSSKPQARPPFQAVCDMLDMMRDGGLEDADMRAALRSAMLSGQASFIGSRGNRVSLDQARSAMEGLFTSKGSKLPSAPASHYNSQHSSSRISMDQAKSAVEGLFTSKTLKLLSGSPPSGHRPPPARMSMDKSRSFADGPRQSRTMRLLSRKTSSVAEPADEPEEVKPAGLASRKSLAGRPLTGRRSLSRNPSKPPRDNIDKPASGLTENLPATPDERERQAQATRKGLTSGLFGKKLRDVFKSPSKLGAS